jgi:hypothetical protein
MMKRLLVCVLGLVVALSLVGWGEESLPDLNGHWALLQVTSDYWKVPLVGERQRTGRTVAKLMVEQEGWDIVIRDFSYCASWIDSGTAMVQVKIGEDFVKSIRTGPVHGRLRVEGEDLLMEVPWFVQVNGARLSDPEHDPLPGTPDDPRVIDQDADGQPGITTRITVLGLISGEAYVVQRVRLAYRGVFKTADRLRGRVLWEEEQITLGASSIWLAQPAQGRPDPNLDHSYFLLLRIKGDEPCEEILSLFSEELKKGQ